MTREEMAVVLGSGVGQGLTGVSKEKAHSSLWTRSPALGTRIVGNTDSSASSLSSAMTPAAAPPHTHIQRLPPFRVAPPPALRRPMSAFLTRMRRREEVRGRRLASQGSAFCTLPAQNQSKAHRGPSRPRRTNPALPSQRAWREEAGGWAQSLASRILAPPFQFLRVIDFFRGSRCKKTAMEIHQSVSPSHKLFLNICPMTEKEEAFSS